LARPSISIHRIALVGLLLGLAGCHVGPPPASYPSRLTTEQDVWWQRLTGLCGRQFDGRMTEGSDSVFVRHRLSIHVDGCGAREVRIGFVIGPDSSRSWVVRQVDGGFALRHELSEEDGTDGRVSGYGGRTRDPGSATRQDFVADPETGRLLPAAAANVWSLEIAPGRILAYTVARPGARQRFRLEFDLRAAP
jgi:hypothetical protein